LIFLSIVGAAVSSVMLVCAKFDDRKKRNMARA
jgi:hypothetical protein